MAPRSKVFCIGQTKTGTTTFDHCMRILGYRHLGFREGLTERVIGRGDIAEAYRLAGEYESFDDWPWCMLFREMDERYPDAKFVLTLRKDSVTWFESYHAHAKRAPKTATWRENARDRSACIARYEKHNCHVRAYFEHRPEKLMEVCWENGDGWKELCEFLGEEIPNQPFPHANKRPSNLFLWKMKKTCRRYRNGLKRRLGL